MKNYIKLLPIALLGLLAPAAKAQQLPVLTVAMTEIDIAGMPAYGANLAGEGSNGGLITNSGQQLNGGNAPYGSSLTLWAVATGTSPASGFTYTFFVNGVSIGIATPTPSYNFDYGLNWIPPQPGVYFFSVMVTDGLGHTAVSLAVEFYATGIEIVSPLANTDLPIGSSVVIQAATSLAIGAVSSVDFFQGNNPAATPGPGAIKLGNSRTFPYSLIYTPPAVNPQDSTNILRIYAVSYKADGTVAFVSSGQGIIMVPAVLKLPVVSIGSPANVPPGPPDFGPATIAIPNYVADPNAFIPVQVNASSPQGDISQVQLYINGVLFGTQANYPYDFQWQPSITGTYNLTALAYDDKNNVIASTTSTLPTLTPAPTTVIVGALPSIAITTPSDGATISGGGPTNGTASVTATATDTNVDANGNAVPIVAVAFYQDGNLVGTATTPNPGTTNVYSVTFVPKQNIDPVSLKPIPSLLTAQATDSLGFQSTSATVTVNVNVGGNTTSPIVGTPPTISISAPANNANVVVNSPVTLSANAQATNTPGNVASVEFLVDNVALTTLTAYPYSATWTPTSLGTYTISAEVTDNDGNVATSPTISVTVVTEPPPTVSIISPQAGSISTVSQPITLTADASAPSGTITQVQFFENGIAIGTPVTSPPYTTTFTPLSSGVYTLTAVATDNAGETTTSSADVIEALPTTGGLGTVEYFGNYLGLTNGGIFAFITVDGTFGTFISYSTSGSATPVTELDTGLVINSNGTFTGKDLTGVVTAVGINGTLTPSNDVFIGGATLPGTFAVNSGYYTGSLVGQSASKVIAIVGSDGEIMVYAANGPNSDVAYGYVDSTGAFSITTAGNNTITGKVDPVTGLFTGTLSGPAGGSILAAKVTGGTFSDGVLRNLATRGPIGSGADAMVAGFVVGGSAPKQLLVRAIGPTLSTFGIPGPIAATNLQVFSGSNVVSSNIGWGSTTANATAITSADSQVGAFALPTGSADSALVSSFPPGSYTAMVTGVSGVTGVGLVEVYDMDAYTPFTTQKLVNVSTRGSVGTGTNVLIAGFNFNGSAPKRLLIRGAGPGLTGLGVSGALATPHLQIYNSSQQVIRENYSWQTGNDPAQIAAAEQQAGAFLYANGSADSAVLIVLQPGTYTAELSGAANATGIGLVEVYEVP